jgi:hypothetical protein
MIRSIVSRLTPAKIKGLLDYYRFPDLAAGFGGPFNGQCGRQQLFIDLCRTVNFTHIIETGAFRGTTTEYLARESGLPVYSVESDMRSYHYSKHRLRKLPNVDLHAGDSRQFLRSVAGRIGRTGIRPFVYLDAHWDSDLPLREEVEIILDKFDEYLIMIDDFCVPDDSGYGFDRYAEDKTLSLPYIAGTIEGRRCGIAYPELHSSRESGHCRGCVLIFSGNLEGYLHLTSSVRHLAEIGRV